MSENRGDAASDAASDAAPDESRSIVPFRRQAELVDQRGKGVVLVVDSDENQADLLADALESAGYRWNIASRSEAALEALQNNYYDLVVTGLELDGGGGPEYLRHVHEVAPFVGIVVVTTGPLDQGILDNAVLSAKLGVSAFLVRPVDYDLLVERVAAAIDAGRIFRVGHDRETSPARSDASGFEGIIFNSEPMREVLELCARIATTDATVLIRGESGTGKDVLAKAIHRASRRRRFRFVPVNCAALSANLIESELFGHEKGAFTGAAGTRIGHFEHGNGGTIFLDEVGDIPLESQVKLLRVLENREIIRVGANDPIPVDVRVISATHRNLEELVEAGEFREDLYYRLKVVPVDLPPLRERPQDIPPLAAHFLREYSEVHGKRFATIEPEALAALVSYEWKGNVRELRHAIENIIVVAEGPVISVRDLPESIRSSRQRRLTSGAPLGLEAFVGMTVQELEREHIKNTLAHVNGNRQEAARMLGIAERTLYRRIKDFGL